MTYNPYHIFKNDDLTKSKLLAKELSISNSDFIEIQNWFDQLLFKHQELSSDKDEQLTAEKELEDKFNELVSSEIEKKSYKYILPKLLHFNNEFNGAYLRTLYVARLGALLGGNLIPRFVNDKSIKYSPEDFFHVSVYLRQNYFVSPNSNFLEDILKIEHVRGIFKQATSEIKLLTLKNILDIISQKTFHHDIISFKKILKLASAKDTALIDYLKKFKVENNQCCYNIINDILNLEIAEDVWEDFQIKVRLIVFFDTARSATPSANWTKKLDELFGNVDNHKLLQTANTVLKNENCKTHKFDDGLEWGDDTAKRFLKSAQWIKDNLK
ncbi:hypothetical protein CEQ15_11315 [Chryseobacterium indologenes]|uniref:hypothetical protein n=1 Tax=Chryseobacterium indologenes TaxID=253 RepID=UPI000B515447|nr:hypothetical protein [Chryseobacterium indologenes]ASE62037.1 hypothetical protein CEQ15_11315 [Chryseobacterium indologenes]